MFDHSHLVPYAGGNHEETVDGCPAITLDDTAYDIRHFLLVMYRRNYLYASKEITFSVLAALMRVGDKYGAHDLLHECMPHFRQMRAICLRSVRSAGQRRSVKSAGQRRSEMKFDPHHAVEALHLCRIVGPLVEEPDILIWMLFLCAQLDEHDLRNGTKRTDGTPELRLSDADVEQILAIKKGLQRRGAAALEALCRFGRRPKVYDCRLYNSEDP